MAFSLLFRQIRALTFKDLLLILNRKRRTSTIIRAFTIPIILTVYMSFILRVYWPKQTYGIGNPSDVRSLSNAIATAPGNRRTLALCNYGPKDGDINRVIERVTADAQGSKGQKVELLSNPDDLLNLCKSSLSGVTKCFGAVEFYSSPNEGAGGLWNYSIRVDGALGYKINIKKDRNDAEIFTIPLQHAVDAAIAQTSSEAGAKLLTSKIKEYPYTSETQDQWDDKLVTGIQNANAKYIAIVWYIGFIGLCYQLVGVVAREREQGMADLLESMMPNERRWEPHAARLVGHWLAFNTVYGGTWIVMAVIAKIGLFPKTNPAILIVFFVLTGLSLNSFSLLGASFFRRAQLSGITVTVVALVLGVAAQISAKTLSTGAAVILSILFTPMTFVFHMIWLARYEHKQISPNLVEGAPGASWRVPGLAFWIIMLLQIIVYPILAAMVERSLYQTSSKGRSITYSDSAQPVVIKNFTKIYNPNWFYRTIAPLFGIRKDPVQAVKGVSVAPMKGQIMVLVGANGCGKSTTLNAIAGLGDVTSGSIVVNGSGGIGICPQKNVLWDFLTVAQHARIFTQIKSTALSPNMGELSQLIYDCGLSPKMQSMSYSLSGGQRRKLQLIMMLTGGSHVCCVDEVSGGLDPLSRRKIWDILLAARGTRTIILTTHFLDEAEFLADHMVIMSKGSLKADGSVSELKSKLGGGYRFRFLHGTGYGELPDVEDLFTEDDEKDMMFDQTVFTVCDIPRSIRIIKELEKRRVKGYQVTGPTMEEVFMKLAEDPDASGSSDVSLSSGDPESHDVTTVHSHKEKKIKVSAIEATEADPLMSGRALGFLQQGSILFKKRMIVLKRNYLPYTFAFLIPIIATAFIAILLRNKQHPGCLPNQLADESDFETLSSKRNYRPLLVIGPSSALTSANLTAFQTTLPKQFGEANTSQTALLEYIKVVDSLEDYHEYFKKNFSKINPGGFFLGDEPVFSYYSNMGFQSLYTSIFMQNAMDKILTNTTIATSFRSFNIPWPSDLTNQFQFVFYFGLIMSCYPAFFALYPTVEKLRSIRALQYSNGARPFPLWLAYLSFDWLNILVTSGILTIILAATAPDNWWHIGYLFVVLFLYGLASLLWSYMVSLFAKSQLAAFAIAAAYQAFMLLMYFTGMMNIQSQMEPTKVADALSIFNFTFTLVTPTGCLIRALVISMNMFGALCRGSPPVIATYPGEIKLYGTPILYLLGQSMVMFGILMIVDHGWAAKWFHKMTSAPDGEDQNTREPEVSEEISRVSHATDGLRVQNLTRTFKSRKYGIQTAVDDLTFGVKKGEVFAVVGPNGAGKSTTIAMLRGELLPSRKGADIHLGSIDVQRNRREARAQMGVCPQFDAVDQMTVLEHLEFYAGVRGVTDAKRNARQIVKAVGLERFAASMASKLSGGNKRKLSLGIALIGNPELVLLDEPSSGMDPLAKRTMWKTLSEFVPGRSVLLTTHSMEEADHLADRVGVLAKRMLDIGTTSHLREKHGHGFHIQLICKSAPHTPDSETDAIKKWIETTIPGAELEGFAYHGQMRYNIHSQSHILTDADVDESGISGPSDEKDEMSVGKLFVLLEENKDKLGLEYYSVSPSTFDEVFLRVVGKHGVKEEDAPAIKKDWKYYVRTVLKTVAPFFVI